MSAQRVMITAAAAGIGRSIARAFADEGAKVHICDVNEAALAEFRDENPEIAATHVNVRSEGEIEAWFDDALDDLGGLDVLVNNAGIKGPTALVDDIDYADWRECIEVCLDSHFLCARRAAPVMKAQGSGSIINLSSMAGMVGYGRRSPYAAAKWAIVGLTKSLAIELGPHQCPLQLHLPGHRARRAHQSRHRRGSRAARRDLRTRSRPAISRASRSSASSSPKRSPTSACSLPRPPPR